MPVRSATLAGLLPSVASSGPGTTPKPSKPAIHAPVMRPPLAIRARRAWKRLAENRSRPALVIRHAVRAFKMGIYFKVLISLVLLARLANHGAQMYPPSNSITREQHFAQIESEDAAALAHASGARAPSLRLVVLAAHDDAPGLKTLISSLAAANYEGVHEPVSFTSRLRQGRFGAAPPKPRVSLDVWLFASSTANALPIIFLPLAIALFGPPRYDHVVAREALSFRWPHGPKHVVACNQEPDLMATWTPTPASRNETLIFVDASRARFLSSNFYQWLRHAHQPRPDISAYALDAISFPNHEDRQKAGKDFRTMSVATEAFFPATAVFSPTREAWITFQKWHRLRKRRLWSAPVLPYALRVGQYDRWEALRMDPVRAWFSQFSYEYQARIVHPWLPDGQVLVVRKEGFTDCSDVSGAGVHASAWEQNLGVDAGSVHLSVDAEVRANAHSGPASDFRDSEDDMLVVKWGGQLAHLSSCVFGADDGVPLNAAREKKRLGNIPAINMKERIHRVGVRDLGLSPRESESSVQIYSRIVAEVTAHGRAHHGMHDLGGGGAAVALALIISDDDLEAASSWLCNLATLRIAPPGLVIAVRDDDMAVSVRQFIGTLGPGSVGWRRHPKAIDPLIVSLSGVKPQLVYLLLTRDVLDQGVAVLRVAVDQVWLSDPLPYVSTALSTQAFESGNNVKAAEDDGEAADVVVTRTSDEGAVSPSFMYLRSSFAARFLWSEVVTILVGQTISRGPAARIPPGFGRSVLTLLVQNQDRAHAKRYPAVKWLAVSEDLFVDSTWYQAFEGAPVSSDLDLAVRGQSRWPMQLNLTPYRSESSRHPVVANLAVSRRGDSESLALWKRRARQAGHWFLGNTGMCVAETVQQAVGGVRSS